MKSYSAKTRGLLLLFFLLPLLSDAQESPMEHPASYPSYPWLYLLITLGAIAGVIKMWKQNEPMR